MKFTAEFDDHLSVDEIGGKGAHLQKLAAWGAPVAPFFIITTDCYRYYLKEKSIPVSVEARILSFLEEHKKLAFRSSMVAEDNVDNSFAGLFETCLDVNSLNWRESLIRILDSIGSKRAFEYIAKKKLTLNLEMAVVAQKLIEVDKSGVLFTRSPVEPTSTIAVDGAFGMGEGVVSGHATVDQYLFTRSGDLVKHNQQNEKPVLQENEASTLIALSLSLEKKLKAPADIEWGFKNGEIFIFQIRPITRSFQKLTYLVDTNLSESYPGTVSPFTSSFVKKAYERTFRESAHLLGASPSKIRQLNPHYEKLVSCVDNHLYYNLEHYYAVLRALPGGQKNIQNWHKMIGGSVDEGNIPFHKTELSRPEAVITYWSLLKLILRRKKIFKNLLIFLEETKKRIEEESLTAVKPDEIIHMITRLIDQPLGFGFTVVNDVFIMLGLGRLSGVLKKKEIPEEVLIEMLQTKEGVESTKPLEHLDRLIKKLDKKTVDYLRTKNLIPGKDPYSSLFNEMRNEGMTNDIAIIQDFLKKYGDRSFEELKLESLPMKNNPVMLLNLIEWAMNTPQVIHRSSKESTGIRLNFIDQKILNFTREAVEIRENTRLLRGNFFQLIRQLVLNLSETLKKNDVSWRQFEVADFFSVTPGEWLLYADKKISQRKVQNFMKHRGDWKNNIRSYPEIIQWVETEKLPDLSVSLNQQEMSGQGVSPGVSEAVALVIESPNEAMTTSLKDFILITKNTDPAWVYIMSRSKGLISEKGSLLSHTAIIGRELNIPTIVGFKHATKRIKTGQLIRMDATKGTVEIL